MKNEENTQSSKLLISFVGMPGAGKSEATAYSEKKGLPLVYFGQLTKDILVEKGLPVTPDNERACREEIRRELGMAAYAIKAKPKIEELLKQHDLVILDSIYSWEEYKYLDSASFKVILIYIYASPTKRYARLAKRKVRPLTQDEARLRDIAEIEKINKGGPIAIADYLIENNTDNLTTLYQKVDMIFETLFKKV